MIDRELDALVAEKVMGLKEVYFKKSPHFRGYIQKSNGELTGILEYSKDISAAWEVVEKLLTQNWNVALAARKDNKYACLLTTDDRDQGNVPFEESAPKAICLAALKAVGYEHEEK